MQVAVGKLNERFRIIAGRHRISAPQISGGLDTHATESTDKTIGRNFLRVDVDMLPSLLASAHAAAASRVG